MRASLLVLSSLFCGLLSSAPAVANPVRLHGTAAAARALDEYQSDEFGWGLGGLGAVELGLSRELGLQLELGGIWLSEGDDPADPTIKPQEDGAAALAGLGLRLRPFARQYEGRAFSAAGFWLSAAGGIAKTGEHVRPTFNAQLGYDILLADGHVGVGPMVGYVHIIQPDDDDEFRREDANIGLIGAHVTFDTAGVGKWSDGDRDRDGIRDSVDRCPDDPEDLDGFEDEDGCPESDNDRDGILDSVDKCPMEPEDKDGFEDEDGCPEGDGDRDKDGIVDPKDKCPDEPEDRDGFEDEDGCPDPDNDKDGIPDLKDQCPNEPETKNGYADDDGCPDEEQVRVLGDKIVLDDRVHFATNMFDIRGVSFPLLGRLGKLLKEHQEYTHIQIEGHADERGTDEYNQKLSENRAKAVMEFLVRSGVDRSRLSAVGYGRSQPLVDKSNPDAWQINRRVEFRVTRNAQYTGAKAPELPTSTGLSDLPKHLQEKAPSKQVNPTPERELPPEKARPAKPNEKPAPAAPKSAPKSGAPGESK